MTTVTEDGGRTNVYATEPTMYTEEPKMPHNEFAEKLNGRVAMLGVIAAIGSYAVTGQLIPGLW
jgi:hypothetical protein